MTPVEGFNDPEILGCSGVRLPVYVSTGGEMPLVVLHELPGMSPSFIAYCRRMSSDGFRVYMPLMFKAPGTEMGLLQTAGFCMSQTFRDLFAAGDKAVQGRPIVNWLAGLISHVGSVDPGRRIGVVGMCLTGNFALAGIADPNVAAAVACQPAYPFVFGTKTLGMTSTQKWKAVARARSLPHPCAKAYRYGNDWRCRRQHINAIRAAFGEAFEMFPELPGASHSTLTSTSASEAVYQDAASFLRARLQVAD